MTFIDELKNTVPMELRSSPQETDYLDAVISLKDAAAMETQLARLIGPPHKITGLMLRKQSELKDIINRIGGVMIEQTLFYRRENGAITYAMLWPWDSDPSRITLKAGIIKEP